MTDRYEVVYPLGVRGQSDREVAASLPDLNGKTIGMLWNYAFRGNEVFPIVEEELKRRYPDVRVVPYEVFGNFHDPAYEAENMAALPGRIREQGCDAVIAGIGC